MLLTTHLTSATKVYYVSPDDISLVYCPTQPCATLSQYLQDNSTLSFVSDVQYHFLPGEHLVTTDIVIHHVNKFVFSGSTETLPSLKCHTGVFIMIYSSSNVNITHLSIEKCGIESSRLASVFLHDCAYCNIIKVNFYPPVTYSITGINLLGECYLDRIVINFGIPSSVICGKGILLEQNDNVSTKNIMNSTTTISNFIVENVTGCPLYDEDTLLSGFLVIIKLRQRKYSATTKIHHSLFHKIDCYDGPFIFISSLNVNLNYLHIENCTFANINLYISKDNLWNYSIPSALFLVVIRLANTVIRFKGCTFYLNKFSTGHQGLIHVAASYCRSHCNQSRIFASSIIIDTCTFIENYGILLHVNSEQAGNYDLVNVLLIGHVPILYNTDYAVIMVFDNVAASMEGNINITSNKVFCIFFFSSSSLLIKGNIEFNSNDCVVLIEVNPTTSYALVEEYTNIIFADNGMSQIFLMKQDMLDKDDYPSLSHPIHYDPNHYCLFQYIASNNTSNSPPPTDHYNITFIGNSEFDETTIFNNYMSLYHFNVHCKWLPNAAYLGYHAGTINEKIFKIPDHYGAFTTHTRICLCSSDDKYNCSIDEIGPVYPGQVLQTKMSLPGIKDMSFVYIETAAASLPKTACKVVHQTDMTNMLNEVCKTLKFTIVSNSSKECELFLTAQPDMHTVYDAFYVKLMKCPIGFILSNGVCNCDPLLTRSSLHIDTCYIDHIAIRRPANSWISSLSLTNITKYSLSTTCPMDYCLPHSSALNLSNPDLQCQFNRSGILCSQCQHGLSMVFGSSRCMKCTNVHILITLIVIVAGIVLVVLLYLLNLTVTNGTINGIIFYANIVSINDSVFLVNDNVFKPLKVFISFINLDLGIETCYYNGMDSYAKMWLQLFFPLYLILIATFIIITSRYSYRIQRLTYTRSLPVLATLFLLSYTGILRAVSTVLFSYSTITELPSGHQRLVWSIDASVPLFGVKFTTLFITCLALFLILIPFNFTLLFTRTLFQFKMINCFKPFLDAFQGSHNDSYYYWIAIHMVMRNIFFALYAVSAGTRLNISAIILVFFCVASGYMQPYKNKFINIQELFLLANLTILYGMSNSNMFFTTVNVMVTTTLLQFSLYVLYNFFTYTCHFNIIMTLLIMEKRLKSLIYKEKVDHLCNVQLLNIPERAYNYNEYREGLVTGDFSN